MDVKRPPRSPWSRMLWGALLVAGIGGSTAAVARLRPAVPTVERASVWIETVRRGTLLRQVRAAGTLVPEEIRWITAHSAGRIERILLLPGVAVKPETVLVELHNPELAQAVLDLEAQLRAAVAQRERLRLQLESERLAHESVIATLRSDLTIALIEAEGDETLRADGNGPALAARRSSARARELGGRVKLEERRLGTLGGSGHAQLVVQEAEIARIRAQYQLRRQQRDSLQVRAGIEGVLQRLGDEQPLRVGQHVVAGGVIARIANQTRLKAELKVAETQARDVQLGQAATIDTRNGLAPGRVVRVDPAVQNGSVTVDVALDAPLPRGARPDLSVDGTITLERLDSVLYLGRPAGAPADAPTHLFKLTVARDAAIRTPVRLGRASVDTIEAVEGLGVGDQVIVSDMSQWDAHDRIRID